MLNYHHGADPILNGRSRRVGRRRVVVLVEDVAGSQLGLRGAHFRFDASFRLHQLGGLGVRNVLLLLPFRSTVLEPDFHLQRNIQMVSHHQILRGPEEA